LKVAVLIDRFLPEKGGAERALAHLIEALEEQGHAALVFGLEASPSAPGSFQRVDVPHLARGKLERELALRSLAAAQDAGCDVTLGIRHLPEVDVYWPHGGLHRATLAAGEAAKGRVAGTVSAVLHRVSLKHRTFLDLEEDLLARGGAGVIWCVSELVARELSVAHPTCGGRIEVHPNGVDLGRFHPRLRDEHRSAFRAETRIGPDVPLLLFVGGNWRLKGWPAAVDALAAMGDREWRLIAVGRQADRAVGLAHRAGVGERVLALPHQDLRPAYGAADLLLQPTHRDPCSLVTLEALACGLPVLTTDANGALDAISDTAAGSVVSASDQGALVAALAAWLDQPPDRDAAACAARTAVEGRSLAAWTDGLIASLARAGRA